MAGYGWSPADGFTTSSSPSATEGPHKPNYDLIIYYGDLVDEYVTGLASRWDVQDYSVIVETWLKKADLQLLRSHITPAAVGELYNILGRPRFYDKTWRGENTLKLSTYDGGYNSTMPFMRKDEIIYVKNISDVPLKGPSGFLNFKIEGYLSGSNL